MFKADVYFKHDGRKTVDIINIQVIPRQKIDYPYSLQYPYLFDEINIIYLDSNNEVHTDIVSNLSDINVING